MKLVTKQWFLIVTVRAGASNQVGGNETKPFIGECILVPELNPWSFDASVKD